MRISRRAWIGAAAVAALGTLGGLALRGTPRRPGAGAPPPEDDTAREGGAGMRYRPFGSTGMNVSEVGFGAWAIGGTAYGAVERSDSLAALARAEELGCNFVDTAMVYGDSEQVLGEFLRGRRARWIVASKYSDQEAGIEATLDDQLRRLGTDFIDFYQIHWAPSKGSELYESLYRLKKAGKARAVGVSLYTAKEIDRVLDHTEVDGFQVKLSLFDPEPFVSRLDRLRARRPAVVIRSALKEGFLTGKFRRNATFPDPNDQRHKWTREQIAATVDAVEKFRFLEAEAGSMVVAAARYPLSFPEVSTVILGTKNAAQAESNFGQVPGPPLSSAALDRVHELQIEQGLQSRRRLLLERLRGLVGRG